MLQGNHSHFLPGNKAHTIAWSQSDFLKPLDRASNVALVNDGVGTRENCERTEPPNS